MSELLIDGPLTKLRRARAQAEVLKAEMSNVHRVYAPLVLVTTTVNVDDERFSVRVTHVADLPSDWGLRIGEIAHHFRGALDHLAYLLALSETDGAIRENPHQIAFPLAGHPDRLDPKGNLRKRFSTAAWELIKSLQPYEEWDGATFLNDLRDLTNHDKHRLIQTALVGAAQWVTKVRAEGHNCRIPGGAHMRAVTMTGRPLEADQEVLTVAVEVTGPAPSLEVEIHTPVYVSLPDGKFVVDVLTGIGSAVEEVLATASPLLLADFLGDKAHDLSKRIQTSHRRRPRADVEVSVGQSPDREWWIVAEGVQGHT